MISPAISTPVRTFVEYDSVRIEVLARGSGPRIVMMPSLGRGATDFDEIASRVAAAGFRALCPQPRGLGASRGPLENITLHDFTRDIAAVIEHDGGGPTVVAGHAFGNFVARTMAADYPQLVRAVVLLAATHTWPLAPALRDSINKCHMMNLPEDVRLKHLQHVFFASGSDARVWLDGWDEEVMHAERAATEATPKEEWWTAGKAPVLDVLALDDPLSPPDSTSRYRDEWGADRVEIVSIPNAAHALLPEQPAAVADALIAYMKKLP
ncbi:MAG: alpha/beta fold hydrolase [Burkholderiales bacterium]|nr:alpha/beta fold hydrolase [Burkholderiales bacterium]